MSRSARFVVDGAWRLWPSRWKACVSLSPFAPGHPLHRDEPIRPLFIVGTGRSGTTLMRRILVESRQIHIPPEVHGLGRTIKDFASLSGLPWETLTFLMLGRFEFSSGFRHFGASLRPLAPELLETPPPRRSLAHLVDSIYRFHGRHSSAPSTRWGDKSPINAYSLPWIRRVFPRARFLHVLRDGCDVVESMLRTGRYRSLEKAASRWRSATSAATTFGAKHPERYAEVRYEALVTRPESVTKEVCSFARVEFDPRMLESTDVIRRSPDVAELDHLRRVASPISDDRVGTGRRALSSEQLRRLDELIGPDMERLGYQPCR